MTLSKQTALHQNCDNTVRHRRRSPRLAMNSKITTSSSCNNNISSTDNTTSTSNSRSENRYQDGEEMGVNISISVNHHQHVENNEVIVVQDDPNEQLNEVDYRTPKRRRSTLKMPEIPRINRFLPVHWDEDMHETRRCLKF